MTFKPVPVEGGKSHRFSSYLATGRAFHIYNEEYGEYVVDDIFDDFRGWVVETFDDTATPDEKILARETIEKMFPITSLHSAWNTLRNQSALLAKGRSQGKSTLFGTLAGMAAVGAAGIGAAAAVKAFGSK